MLKVRTYKYNLDMRLTPMEKVGWTLVIVLAIASIMVRKTGKANKSKGQFQAAPPYSS